MKLSKLIHGGRFAPAMLVAGVLSVGALAMSTTGTLAGFTAQITNSANAATSGSLVMQESATIGGTAYTCASTDAGSNSNTVNTNASTCSTINKYGGSATMVPGGAPVSTTVVLKNIGNIPATTFTMATGVCAQSNGPATYASGTATDLCAKINVAVTSGATSIASGTAASLASKTVTLAAPVAPGTSVTFTFAVSLDTSATNSYQNLQASQPIVWAFAS